MRSGRHRGQPTRHGSRRPRRTSVRHPCRTRLRRHVLVLVVLGRQRAEGARAGRFPDLSISHAVNLRGQAQRAASSAGRRLYQQPTNPDGQTKDAHSTTSRGPRQAHVVLDGRIGRKEASRQLRPGGGLLQPAGQRRSQVDLSSAQGRENDARAARVAHDAPDGRLDLSSPSLSHRSV